MAHAENKIRVLHIIGNLRFGGAETVVSQIVENSNKDIYQHYIYPLRPAPNDKLIQSGVIMHSRFNYDIRKFFDLVKICKKKKIDILHAHLQKCIMGALLLTYFHKVPVIIHEHGPITRSGISNTIYRLFLRCFHKRSKAVVANSNAIAKALQQYAGIDPEKTRVIPNAVDIDRFQPEAHVRAKLRHQYHLSEEDIVIGFAGRLHPVKGIDCLVESMKILNTHNNRFKLFIAGDGPLEDELTQRTNEMHLGHSIRFLGYCKNMAEVMNIFDIGCVPSRHEAFGISAIEMMSMQVPLVCSSTEGLAELTENRKTALHIEKVTAEAIAARIIELSEDKDLQKELVKNGSDFCKDYGIDRFIGRIEQLYDSIMNA